MNPKWREVLLYVGLALALLLPRLPALGSFSTLDEPAWLSMGANFYYGLGQREFETLVYEYQPAVTTMWIVTAAMLVYFPEYRGLGQGYLDYEKGVLDPFMLAHGKDPLVLLYTARLIQVFLIAALLLLAFYLLRRLVGEVLALSGLLLAAFDPFFLGQSRLLDHEAMLSCFVLVSVLSLAVYFRQGRKWYFLALSAVAGALAQLTKSSAIALLVPIGVFLLFELWQGRSMLGKTFARLGSIFVIWLVLLVAAYFLFWPGMWTAPGKMLHQVYGNAFSYAFQGARLVALEDVPAPAASVDLKLGSFVRLVSAMLWRTTPLTWIGLLLGIILLLAPSRDEVQRSARLAGTLAGVAALAFVVLFAVAQGRNSPHYILASYVMVNLLAGIGWYLLFRWLSRRTGKAWIPVACMAAILALQAGSALAQYPYYFTYQNPILARLQPPEGPAFAYGEGLELAAEYLASLPGAKDSVALAYYGRGCFSYFFPGQTERFKPYYVEAGHESELRQALDGADYLVVYPAVQGSLQKYAALFQALSQAEPLKEFWLDGYRYAAIYRVDAFPPGVYAALFPNDAP